jgi:hypothetical protein
MAEFSLSNRGSSGFSFTHYDGCFAPLPLCVMYSKPADLFVRSGASYELSPHWNYWLVWIGAAIVLTIYSTRKQKDAKLNHAAGGRRYWAEINSIKPLTLNHAKAIVGHAEEEFASGADIRDAFAPFARGGATTRAEAVESMKIVIADFYRSAAKNGQDAMREFDQYAKGSGAIALRVIADAADSSEVLDTIMKANSTESISSFVQFLKTLLPGDSEYMRRVYDRIGITFPEQVVIDPIKCTPQRMKRAWWRTPVAFVICGLLAMSYFVFVSVAFGWKSGGGFIPVLIAGTVIITIWGLIRGTDPTDEK